MSFFINKSRFFSAIILLTYLTLLVVPVLASNDINLSISTGSASPDSEITLEVKLDKAENIGAMDFTLKYDKNVFKLENGNEDIIINDKVKKAMSLAGVNGKNAGEIIFAGAGTNSLNSSEPVQICTIKFTVLSDVYNGSYDITFTKASVYDETVKKVPATLTNGRIEVTGSTKVKPSIPKPGGSTGTGGSTNNDKDKKPSPTKIDEVLQQGKDKLQQLYDNKSHNTDIDYEALNIMELAIYQASKLNISSNAVKVSGSKAEVLVDNEILETVMKSMVAVELEMSAKAHDLGIKVRPEKTVIIQIPKNNNIKEMAVTVPASVFKSAKNSQIEKMAIDAGMAAIIINYDSLNDAILSDTKNVEFLISQIDADTPKPAFEFKIKVDGKEVTDFNGRKSIEVSFEYNILDGEDPDKIIVYNIDNNLQPMKSCKYNKEIKRVVFKADNLNKYTAMETDVTFDDIQNIDWAKSHIEGLAGRNIISGTGEKMFSPDRNVTREEFAKMLMEAFDFEDDNFTTSLSDVPKGEWYYKYVAMAQNLGIVNGIGDNKFGVRTNISRQDMATMAYRAADIAKIRVKREKPLEVFADDSDIATYSKDSVSIMQQAGIINGVGDNRFAPNDNATRAQAARIIYMLYKN